MKKVIFVIIIIGIVIGIAGFWYWRENIYSKEVLKLEILGPEQAEVFEEVQYTVKYKNNGDVRLEELRFFFAFSEHTLLDPGQKRGVVGELEDIYPGEEKTFQFKARLFGRENEVKTAKVWLNYKPRNLQARYESATTFSTAIKSVPLSFDFDLASRVEAGRDFRFYLNYFSSSDYPISDLGVRIEYPDGFEFLRSSPSSLAKDEWDIPFLNKAEGGRIEIEGKLSGKLNDQKIFKAILGIWKDDEFIPLKELIRGVEITKPQIFVFQLANGSNNYIANPDDLIHYEIFFRNISDEPFSNLFLAVTLDGQAFDFDSIKSDSGQFKNGDNSILWDWRDVSKLRFLARGEEGKVDFWINLKDWDSSRNKNAVLKNSVIISQVKEEFEIKMNSKLAVSQKGFFQDEIFGNSGPMPPKVGEKTTYTITWKAENYYNDVENVRVKAVLPASVNLTGRIFPNDQASKFTFDQSSREIVWRVGDMEAGTTDSNISFQVELTPVQRGHKALIINEAKIRGEDQWTERIIESTFSQIDTNLIVR